ncbi:uncharacterized protein LOC124898059 [Capsicum annuum]|uniref:uncharacterized protein LOC124898059 n=1 Tax=Capsicum annuum TaxID=4072 RepID=UPI001FB15042|nr:uncharacterized protein LOC124898059 [Capsicum annuum]
MADIAFMQNGFKGWNNALERFETHIGEVNSIHNKCFNMMIDLINQSQSICTSFDKHSKKEKNESHHRLSASIDEARFLLRLRLSFHGHDESVSSTNRDIVDACTKETIKVIMEDLDGDYFRIIVAESKDISHKEQMELVLRYIDKKGEVIERFIGVVNLQLTLVSLVKKNLDVDDFFCLVTNVLNNVGASYKRRNLLTQHQAAKLEELIISGSEVPTGWAFGIFTQRNDGLRSTSKYGVLQIPKIDARYIPEVLVESELHQIWPLVYLLIKLTLILPVATASVERSFSSTNYIKNELRNNMGDEFLNGCLVCYVERKIFATVNNNAIIHHFQNIKSHRAQL